MDHVEILMNKYLKCGPWKGKICINIKNNRSICYKNHVCTLQYKV